MWGKAVSELDLILPFNIKLAITVSSSIISLGQDRPRVSDMIL
jgi:hypothetical protein